MRVPKKDKGFLFQKTIPVYNKAPVFGYRSIRQRLCGNFREFCSFQKNSFCTFLMSAAVLNLRKKFFENGFVFYRLNHIRYSTLEIHVRLTWLKKKFLNNYWPFLESGYFRICLKGTFLITFVNSILHHEAGKVKNAQNHR